MSETQKDCRENEKHWRDHCVDVNLAEVWLERLNHLLAFNLMSICEGHHTQVRGSVGRFPHIYLKLKESYLPGFVKEWDNLRSAFMDEVHKNFQLGDTYFNLEMKTKLRAGRGRLVRKLHHSPGDPRQNRRRLAPRETGLKRSSTS
jgi:hypothetical protein